VTGRVISLDGQPATIVGVLPAGFEMPNLTQADVVMPMAWNEAAQQRPQNTVLRVFARLTPGVTPDQAKAALQPLYEKSLTFVPPRFQKMVGLRVRSVRDRQLQDSRLASWMLLGAVGAVLLIACANVANLLLARAAGRRRELAVRAALGAGRGRLIKQTLTESLTLALIGGVAGCLLAGLLLKLFLLIAPRGIPHLDQAALDPRVLLFTFGVSVVSGVVFGLAPAFDPFHHTDLSGSRAVGPSRHLFRQLLMAGQFAVSIVLLAGAGLLLNSLWKLQSVPLGIQPDTVLTADLALAVQTYPDPKRQAAFFEELETRLQRLPGVSVALSDSVPPAGPMHVRPYVTLDVEGRPPMEPGIRDMVAWRMVTPGYFSALRIPIRQGRAFQDQDRSSSGNLMILSDSLARRLFPGEDPLGKRIKLDPWFTVVGVASDVRNNGLTAQADPEFYVLRKHSTDDPSWRSTSPRRATLLVRSALSSRTVSDWIRSETALMDATLPVQIVPMTQRVGQLSERPRFNAVLLGLFAAMGVLLAAIGLYGVVSCLVIERTQEIGVRMALGATPGRIARMVLSHTARWTAAGAAAGLAGAWIAARWLATLLFQVSPREPRVLAASVALLLTVALIAAWLPSRKAARVDPMAALRQQ